MREPGARTTLVIVAASLALGVWTGREVFAEQPIDSARGAVWGVFRRGDQPRQLAILVEPDASPNDPTALALVQRIAGRHDIDLPEEFSLVERTMHGQVSPDAGWMCIPPSGGPSVRTTPVDGGGVRLVVTCDGEVSSTTYVREGRRVRLVSASGSGQLGPVVAFMDGLIVTVVAYLVLGMVARRGLRGLGARRQVPAPEVRDGSSTEPARTRDGS